MDRVKEIITTLRSLSEDDLELILNFIPIIYSRKSNSFYYQKSDYLLNLETFEIFNIKTKTKLNNRMLRNQLIQSLIQESPHWLKKEHEVVKKLLKGFF